MQAIQLTTEVDRDDTDTVYYRVKATQDGQTGYGRGYSQSHAVAQAIQNLESIKALTPTSPNWENSILSRLCLN